MEPLRDSQVADLAWMMQQEKGLLLHDPGVESASGCQLQLSLGEKDLGVVEKHKNTFDCILTEEGWKDVAFLLEPFCQQEKQSGYQWLCEESPISLLISAYPNGAW